MTAKQIRIAASIDSAMQPLIRAGKDDVAILAGMGEHMADFKHILDTAQPGVMDELCQRYPGFYRYAKVLENIAGAIQSGAIKGIQVMCQVSADEFPRVEELRRELRALPFVRLDDAELSHLRARLLVGHHNNAIEGIEPSPETAALFAMFLQERAPLTVSEPFLDRYIREVLV